jgi:ATP-dependent protease ClpP protease subunit
MFNLARKNQVVEGVAQPTIENTANNVTTINNIIYFTAEVTAESVGTFTRELRRLDHYNLSQVLSANASILYTNVEAIAPLQLPPIYVYISSFGGSLFDGIAAMDSICLCKSPVYTIISGYAASAATLMSVVGKKRLMTENSFALIHQLSSGFWGKYEEFKDEMKNNEKLMDMIYRIYKKHTKINKTDLQTLLKRDIWWDSAECLKQGLVDEIITP